MDFDLFGFEIYLIKYYKLIIIIELNSGGATNLNGPPLNVDLFDF